MALTDFLRAPSKKSLLAMLKKADKLTPRLLDKLFEGVLFKSEFKGYVENGGIDEDYSDYIRKDGTRALTANWDAGSFEIRARTLESDVATGTAPLTIASTTLNTNLNADLLDSQHGSYYLDSDNFTGTEWTDLTDAGATTLHKHDHGGMDGLADDDHTQYLLTDGSRNVTGLLIFEAGLYVDSIQKYSSSSIEIEDDVSIKGNLLLQSSINCGINSTTQVSTDLDEIYFTVILDASSNNVTVNLPEAASIQAGRIYNIKCIDDTNTCAVHPYGAETIDGSNLDITLSLMESITIQSDGANWWII